MRWGYLEVLGAENENWEGNDESSEDDLQCIFILLSFLWVRICYWNLLITVWNWRKHTSENLHDMVLGRAEGEIYCWMWNKPQNKKQSSDEKRGGENSLSYSM